MLLKKNLGAKIHKILGLLMNNKKGGAVARTPNYKKVQNPYLSSSCFLKAMRVQKYKKILDLLTDK